MSVLILAEHNNQQLKAATYRAVTAALQLDSIIDLLIIGSHCQTVVQEASKLSSVRKLCVADADIYAHQLAENTASVLATVGKEYTHILATASTFSKNILPRAAALLGVSMISDVLKVVAPDVFERPLFAGNVVATVRSNDPIKILTVRGTLFPPVAVQTMDVATIEPLSLLIVNTQSQFEKQVLSSQERPELTAARVIISGGRGLKSAENFKLLEIIADRLGAAVGASRAAVDAGYAPNDYQIGQTGKVVAPDLYIAVGISGAIQHLAGMKDSKIVVAINNDPDAPICQSADYLLVGDLFQLLPELQKALGC